MTSETETALDLLGELVAIVRGECPSLLNEDSGGSAELSLRIDAALSRAPGALELGGSTCMTSPASRSQTPLSAGWQEIESNPPPHNKAVLLGWRDSRDGRWISEVAAYSTGQQWASGFSNQSFHGSATHWTPVPAPPAEEDLSGAQRSELMRLAQDEPAPASSPPSTGGEGEAWDRIPPAKRFGRRLDESAVKHLAPGTLLRFYSEDPWFDPSPSSPANGDIVIFTGAVSNTFPKVGPHLEVRTLGGRVYPGGGWVYQIFQFVADPSPEMGEISREEIAREIDPDAWDRWTYTWPPGRKEKSLAKADAILSKLKENGLSREELGGLARSLPSGDAQERSPVPPLSDGGRV